MDLHAETVRRWRADYPELFGDWSEPPRCAVRQDFPPHERCPNRAEFQLQLAERVLGALPGPTFCCAQCLASAVMAGTACGGTVVTRLQKP